MPLLPGTDGVDPDPECRGDPCRLQRLRLADIVAAVGEQDDDPAPARQPAHHVDGAEDRIADRGAVLEREADDPDPVQGRQQRCVIERGRDDDVGEAGEFQHADHVALAAALPVGAALDEVVEGRTHGLQTVARAIAQPEVDGAHAAGDVDRHRDADPFPPGPRDLHARLRPGQRHHDQRQGECPHPGHGAMEPGGEGWAKLRYRFRVGKGQCRRP